MVSITPTLRREPNEHYQTIRDRRSTENSEKSA